MREVTIDAGDNEAALPNTRERITAVWLKGVRRPNPMIVLSNEDFDNRSRYGYSSLMRGVPQFCTIRDGTINILPRPNGKVTILLAYTEDNVQDGYDTTWKRQRGPA